MSTNEVRVFRDFTVASKDLANPIEIRFDFMEPEITLNNATGDKSYIPVELVRSVIDSLELVLSDVIKYQKESEENE